MALRAMIHTQFPFGNILVNTTVNNSKGDSFAPAKIEDVKDLVEVIKAAFGGNPRRESQKRIFWHRSRHHYEKICCPVL